MRQIHLFCRQGNCGILIKVFFLRFFYIVSNWENPFSDFFILHYNSILFYVAIWINFLKHCTIKYTYKLYFYIVASIFSQLISLIQKSYIIMVLYPNHDFFSKEIGIENMRYPYTQQPTPSNLNKILYTFKNFFLFKN